MSHNRKKLHLKDVSDVIYDANTKRVFTKGRFLGKGGFARCYELIENYTRIVYAGKVVSKSLLKEKHQKEKMTQEICIHRNLSHPHIVKMEGCFEDSENVYVLLELCARRSLMELLKRRRYVTEQEARYFIFQTVSACEYLHNNKIIHRDLKLGNLFLNNEMQLKIGDFGLATTIKCDVDRKFTLCGTPNYIAPEMLDKRGHSFEVDVWAIGCVLYTLLVGKPPFETQTIKETYLRIKNNQYIIPPTISKNAASLIISLLAPDPAKRPRMNAILTTTFFTEGILPTRLPTSCLTTPPKFSDEAIEHDHYENLKRSTSALISHTIETASSTLLKSQKLNRQGRLPLSERNDYIRQLYDCLALLQNSNPEKFNEEDLGFMFLMFGASFNSLQILVEVQDPAATPIYWVSKWIDYSQKYGLGYQLCDNSVGIFFNDNTKITLDAAGEQIQYIDKIKKEYFYVLNNCPQTLDKKISLLRHFRAYMTDNLYKTGANIPKQAGDELARLPHLNLWFRSKSVIVMNFSNGTFQINFLQDHSKLILCPLMNAVTYLDANKFVATYKFSLIEQFGCPKDLWIRLKYTKTIIERIINNNLSSRKKSRQNDNIEIGK